MCAPSIRWLCDGCGSPSPPPRSAASSARTCSAAAGPLSPRSKRASAPSSATRRRPSSPPSWASAGCRESGRRFPRSPASGASPRTSTCRDIRQRVVDHRPRSGGVCLRRQRRSALWCDALIAYAIDPDAWTGCTLCAVKCPVDAARGEKKQPRAIDQELCIRCDACRAASKFDAVNIVSGPEEIAAALAAPALVLSAAPYPLVLTSSCAYRSLGDQVASSGSRRRPRGGA
jgi:NAD-dependent dihydropyrimidine dehydrogenase PreA subunit